MKSIITIISLCWGIQLFAQDDMIQSAYRISPPTIDGHAREWRQPFRYYDSKSKIQIAVNHDSDHLYLCLRIADDLPQRKTIMAGIQLWIDATGKKKYKSGILFPISDHAHHEPTERLPMESNNPHEPTERLPMESNNPHDMKVKMLPTSKLMELRDWAGIPNGETPTKNAHGITVAIAWDTLEVLTIEYEIPFTALAVRIDSTTPISIALIARGISQQNIDKGMPESNLPSPDLNMSRAGGMPTGGMGGSMPNRGAGGTMGVGMPQGSMPMGAVNEMAQENKRWYKVKIGN